MRRAKYGQAGKPMPRRRRFAPLKPGDDYRRIWRLVDGAVRDAFAHHPDYIARGRRESDVRLSIVKRVTGAVLGHAEQSARGRSGAEPAADTGGRAPTAGRRGGLDTPPLDRASSRGA